MCVEYGGMAAEFTGMCRAAFHGPFWFLITFRMYSNNSTMGTSPPCSRCLILFCISSTSPKYMPATGRPSHLPDWKRLGRGKGRGCQRQVEGTVLSCNIQCIQTDFHRADPFLGACVEYLQIAASLRDCTARVCYLAPLPNDTSWNSRVKVIKVCQNRAKKAEIKIRTLRDWVHGYHGTVIFSSRWQVRSGNHWRRTVSFQNSIV